MSIGKILNIIFLISPMLLLGQSREYIFHIENFSNKHIELTSNFSAVLKDSRGMMWFGTANGLFSFDGYEITRYDESENSPLKLSSVLINDLDEDRRGRLLVATDNGLNILDFQNFRNDVILSQKDKIHQSKGFYKNKIDQILIVKDTFWLNEGGSICKISPKGFDWMHPETIFKTKRFRRDTKGNIWAYQYGSQYFVINAQGNIIYDGNFNTPLPIEFIEPSEHSECITPIDEDFIFETLFQTASNLEKETQISFQEINFNATCPNSFIEINQETDFNSLDQEQLELLKIKDHFFDTQLAWIIGFPSLNNLSKVRITPKVFNQIPDLRKNSARGMYEDENGDIYIGTYSGLAIYNRKSGETELLSQPKGITTIHPISKDSLFMTCDGCGLHIFDKQKKEVLYSWDISSEKVYFHKVEDQEGNIWLSSRTSLYIIDSKWESREFSLPSGGIPFKGIKVTALFIDKNGFIWVASRQGLFKCSLHEGILEAYDFDHPTGKVFTKRRIRSIIEDNQGNFWMASNQGLMYFNPTTEEIEKYYNISTGLPSNELYSILPEKDSILWIGTQNGLCRFDISNERFSNYFEKDGISSNEFNRKSYLKTRDGNLWFGGVKGLTFFAPEDINLTPNAFEVFIPKVVQYSHQEKDLKEVHFPVSYHPNLRLKPNEKFIEFYFATSDYVSPQENIYAYRLEGLEDEWILSKHNSVRYSNLKAGNYTFRLKAQNAEGTWSTNEVFLDLQVRVPFYNTAWFWILVPALILAFAVTFYQRQLRKQRRLLRLRKKIAKDLHDDVSNTLNLIRMTTAGIQSEKAVSIKNEIELIRDMSKEAIENMHEAIWSIDRENSTSGDVLEKLQDYIDRYLRAKGVKVNFEIDNFDLSIRLPFILRRNFLLILKEAISNITKHSYPTEVFIIIKKYSDGLNVHIQNNFESLKSEPFSTGRGLSNMEYRAKEIGGVITTDQKKNCFIFNLRIYQ